MHKRLPILISVGLVLAVILLCLQLSGSQESTGLGRSGPQSKTGGEVGSPADLRGTASDGERTAATTATTAQPLAHSAKPDATAAEGSASTDEQGIILRGTVRWSDDRQPVPYLRLVVHFAGGGSAVLNTDAEGRFASGPEVRPGIARLWHLGDVERPDGGQLYPKRLLFAPESFSIPPNVAEHEVEILLRRPDEILEVQVVYTDGRPAQDATVALEVILHRTPTDKEHTVQSRDTDSRGITSFSIYEPQYIVALGLLVEWRAPTKGEATRSSQPVALVSDQLTLEMPLLLPSDGPPLRLVLDEPASLLVHTRTEDGAPIAGQRVWIGVGNEPLMGWLLGRVVSDEHGEALFAALPPSEYEVGLFGSPGITQRQIELRRGIRSEIEFIIPSGAARLAVSGVVLDEEGLPLPRVSVKVRYGERQGSGDTSGNRQTNAAGRFAFQAAPCEGLTVALDGGIEGDEYEPAVREVDFGATGLVFRRVRKFARRDFALEIIDAATGERVEKCLVMSFRESRHFEYGFHSGDGGLANVRISEHPDFRLMIEINGYRRKTIAPLALMSTKPDGHLHRVEVERGFLRNVQVHGDPEDGSDETAITAAEIWDGTRLLGRTDAKGHLHLDLALWPQDGLRIEAAGYAVLRWEPSDGYAELEAAYVWMERAE